jgi:hypothetical protein
MSLSILPVASAGTEGRRRAVAGTAAPFLDVDHRPWSERVAQQRPVALETRTVQAARPLRRLLRFTAFPQEGKVVNPASCAATFISPGAPG